MKQWIVTICSLVFVLVVMFGFIYVTTPNHYINRPFQKCDQNYTVNYGAFQSCGKLMSEDTAKTGLYAIIIGLPLLAFVILPIMLAIKRSNKHD